MSTTYNTDRLFGLIQDPLAAKLDRTPLLAPFVTDAGTVTAVMTIIGVDGAGDVSTSSNLVTQGTLGNNATHEPFTSDIVYTEPYLFTTPAALTQFAWQWVGDHSSAAEHWKFVVYDDTGTGGTPGQLLYVSPEQTIANVGAGGASQTTTYNISGVTIPAGTVYIGIHLNEAHVAPTYTSGGTTYDAPDTYADGPAPFFTGAVLSVNLRDKIVTYVAYEVGASIRVFGAEKIADAGTVTATATQSGSQSISTGDPSDTGTNTGTASMSASEAIADTGTVTAVGTPAGSDTVPDANTVVATASFTGSEAVADSGSITGAVTLSGVGQITDSGTNTATASLTGVEGPGDAGTVSATASQSGDEQALVVTTVTGTASFSAAEAITDQGTVTATATPNGIGSPDTAEDTGSVTAVATTTGRDYIADQGTVTATASNSGTDELLEGGVTATATISAAFEEITDQGTVAAAAFPTAVAKLTDQGTLTVLASLTGADAIGDSGSVTALITLSELEALGDAGTVAAVMSFAASGGHRGLLKGFAHGRSAATGAVGKVTRDGSATGAVRQTT